jgi:hypothetical protein
MRNGHLQEQGQGQEQKGGQEQEQEHVCGVSQASTEEEQRIVVEDLQEDGDIVPFYSQVMSF